MRILLFSDEFPPMRGGIGTYCYNLATELAKLEQDILVLANAHEDSAEFDQNQLFEIKRISRELNSKTALLVWARQLAMTLIRFRPDHVLIFGFSGQVIAALVNLIMPFRYSVIIVGGDVGKYAESTVKKWLFQQLCNRSKNILAISHYVNNLLEEKFGTKWQRKTKVIYIGIDIEEYSQPVRDDLAELRQKIGLEPHHKVILTLARLSARKGHKTIIQAMPKILEHFPDARYVIAGGGGGINTPRHLRELVAEMNLDDFVLFTGEVAEEDKISYLDLCDVFVMMSLQLQYAVEGLGISFLEASAREKPCIGSTHGGVQEVIVDNQTGYLLESKDIDGLIERLIDILESPKKATQFGQNGKQFVHTHFASPVTAQQVLATLTKDTTL
ncbi:MAG: glycosyltransferase family 4 protein [Chloroflexota bacterium]